MNREWSFDTSHWSLIPPQVALELRVFPIGLEDDKLILLTDCLPADDEKRAAFEQMVRNNLGGRQIHLVSSMARREVEFNFDGLLDQFYNINGMPQVVSIPVTRNLGTIVLIDQETNRSKDIRDDFEHEGYEVKCAESLEKGLEIIKAQNGIVRTIFVAPDIDGGYDRAVQEIKSAFGTVKCEAMDVVLREPV